MASELIAEAITDYFGERCLDYAEGCPTCEAWAEYDRWNTRPAPATDIEDLLKKAVAAFNALSPEQQAEMLEEQRQSWVRGNVGLSRDERGMTSPTMPRPAPAATDTGLVTVGEVSTVRESVAAFAGHMSSGQLKPGDLLCLRSQAVELLAAERAKTERWHKKAMDAGVIVHSDGTTSHPMRKELDDLKADNAALTARVKELEGINANLMGDDEDKPRYTTKRLKHEIARATEALEAKIASKDGWKELHDAAQVAVKERTEACNSLYKQVATLEAKLAAAEKALEFYRDGFKYHPKRTSTGINVSEWKPTQTLLDDCGETARAARGGKPS